MKTLGSKPVYLIQSEDENIGTIYTFLPAHTAYGEKNLEIMTLREFVERIDSVPASDMEYPPSRGDLIGMFQELLAEFD